MSDLPDDELTRDLPSPDPDPDPEAPVRARAFSIAFAWGGLIVGGVAWILWWGGQHLPQRGEAITQAMLKFTTTDIVMLAILPFGAAALAGRVGRKWLP